MTLSDSVGQTRGATFFKRPLLPTATKRRRPLCRSGVCAAVLCCLVAGSGLAVGADRSNSSREQISETDPQVITAAELAMLEWTSLVADADRDSQGKIDALPSGAYFHHVEIQQGFAAVYLELPAEFLDGISEFECEDIMIEAVSRLRKIDGLTGFGVLARAEGDAKTSFRPLPDFLPKWKGPKDKPEVAESITLKHTGGLPTTNPGQPSGALSGKTVFLSPGHGWYYSSALGRWATQRGNNYGIIEDHSNGEAVLQHLARYLHNAGAYVWTTRERDFNTNMVIVDNTDGSPAFTTTGTWPTSTAAGTWVGSNYQYNQVGMTESAVATYAPDIPEDGYYSVYVWTPSSSNRNPSATVRVNHTGGTTTHTINMQRDGNTWRFLGYYYFKEGRDADNGSVEISDVGTDTSKYVIADAVRFGGGMGDYSEGGGTSGKPRWEESGRYFPVFMGQTSTPNGTVSAMPIYAKWESESWEDSIYVSWHSNASTGSGHGTSVWVYGPNGPPSPFGEFSGVAGSDSLAERIRDEVVNDLRIAWNDASWPGYLYSAWFGELNPSYNNEMPSCLIEVAYHDSSTDAESILDPRFRDMVSRAMYQAIVKWWYNDADGPNSSSIADDTLLPEPPTHLAVRNLGDGDVRVSWDAPSYNSGNDLLGDAATGYIVQLSTDGYGFNDGTTTASTYLDFTNLDDDEIYYVRVIATNSGGQSFPSEIGAVRVSDDDSPVLVVNGFDRIDKSAMLSEDDPYDADPMIRERLERMNNYAYSRTFAAALEPTGIAFDYCNNEAVADDDVSLSGYDVVIWQGGEESTLDETFDSTEQARVTTYLSGGGSLFVSGTEIGWDLDYLNNGRSFYNNYLKADYAADDAGTYDVEPVEGSIFEVVGGFSFDDGTLIYEVDYPDVITTSGGSSAAMEYDDDAGTAAIIYDSSFQVVHFGFPFETITSADQRAAIMNVMLYFFGLEPNAGDPTPDDIIVESRDSNGTVTSAPDYNEDGAWANSSVKSSAAGLSGTGSRFITYTLPNTGTDNATFIPDIDVAGKYEVFVTWANGANCYDAQYTINHYLGTETLLVDQISTGAAEDSNANQWISLGEYWFDEGQSLSNCSINVSEETVSGRPSAGWNQRVYADGLKLELVQRWPFSE